MILAFISIKGDVIPFAAVYRVKPSDYETYITLRLTDGTDVDMQVGKQQKEEQIDNYLKYLSTKPGPFDE